MSGSILYGAKHGRYIRSELDWAKCGTAANYRGHLRRGEKPCAACRRAASAYHRDWVALRRRGVA